MKDINVGWGPVTWQGVVATVVFGLGAVAAFLTTLAEGMPEKYGVWLTAVAGVLSAGSLAITAAARHYFAKLKAGTYPWDEEIEVDVPEEPTDTETPPPVEPTN